jgi:hypothetical protein
MSNVMPRSGRSGRGGTAETGFLSGDDRSGNGGRARSSLRAVAGGVTVWTRGRKKRIGRACKRAPSRRCDKA